MCGVKTRRDARSSAIMRTATTSARHDGARQRARTGTDLIQVASGTPLLARKLSGFHPQRQPAACIAAVAKWQAAQAESDKMHEVRLQYASQ